MAAKIKKGDKVVVIAGKDKGRHGEVTKVFPKRDRVLVDGINVAAHHRKPTQANPQGGIERVEKPIHISNVAIEDPKTGKPSRVRIETAKDGSKTRVAARSGEAING